MARYHEFTAVEVRHLCQQYGLSLRNFQPLAGGHNNTNLFLNTTAGDFVLTCFDTKTVAEVDRAARTLQWFAQHHFPAPRLLPTGDGRRTCHFQDKPVFVKTFLPGHIRATLDQHHLHQIGQMAGRLHQLPLPTFLRAGYIYAPNHFLTVRGSEHDPTYERWLADQTHWLQQHLNLQLPPGLIHADLFIDNLLFAEDQLLAFIDFEDACLYPCIFDLGMALTGLCRQGSELRLTQARSLIRGYEQARPLTLAEKEALYPFTIFAATAISFWRYWKYNICHSLPEKAHLHQEMAAFASNLKAQSARQFQKFLFD